MTHAQSTASKLRWIMLGLTVACWIVGGWWMLTAPGYDGAGTLGTPAMLPPDDPNQIASGLLFLGLFLLMQWLFLFPRGSWRLRTTDAGRPMLLSVITAAFMAMLLTTAFFATGLEIVKQWTWFTDRVGLVGMWIAMAVAWAIWAVILGVYARQIEGYTWVGRVVRGLIAGSVLELLVAAPVQAMREDECYCARGSYTGLVFGGAVLIWAFGPATFLLFLREKRRRAAIDATPPST